MRILLLGSTGQLGWELERTLSTLGSVTALDYPQVDLANGAALRQLCRQHAPQVIVNATAYTAVDRAESETTLAEAINTSGPGILAEEARRAGALLVHYSTDYVFDGRLGRPYKETDPTNPLNVYGRSKLAGEQAIAQVGGAHWIFRTSWVYSLRRDSFVTKVLSWARQQPSLRLVDDQIGNPTWSRSLAEVTGQLLAMGEAQSPADLTGWAAERSGVYHLAGDGYASRLECGQAILRLDPRAAEQVAREISPAKTADFPMPAQRPLFSALDCTYFSETFGLRLPPWEQALRLALAG